MWGETQQNGQPWVMHLQMDNPPKNKEFYFCINDWHYTSLLTEDLMELPLYMEPGTVCCVVWDISKSFFSATQKCHHIQGPLNVFSIVTPSFVATQERAAQQLGVFAQYNALIGVNATIAYERGTYLKTYLKSRYTSRLVHKGQLKVCCCSLMQSMCFVFVCRRIQTTATLITQIFLWDHLFGKAPQWTTQSFYDGWTHYVKYDQLVIYDHALTMFYGLNTYLWFADHDEYLVIPHQVPHPQIHHLISGNGMECICCCK